MSELTNQGGVLIPDPKAQNVELCYSGQYRSIPYDYGV